MPEQDAVLAHLTNPEWFVLEIGPGGHPTPWAGPYESIDHTEPGTEGTAGSEAGVVCTATRRGDMADLPYGDQTFDALVARHVVEHDPDTLSVLREWGRVLKPGGTLVVITPDQGRYGGSTIALDPTHAAAFTEPQLRALMVHAGFGDFAVTLIDWPRPGWSFCLRAAKS
jgi:SAM-dependent methyltransferase